MTDTANELDLTIALNNVRATTPLVHCITNYVTVNDCANALLACGGSPIMSDEPQDVEDITSICGGLVLNIGTLNAQTVEGMKAAGAKASELKHAIVLDPVGAGASKLRTETAAMLLDTCDVRVIRANMSEAKALTGASNTTRGVDVNPDDVVTPDNIEASAKYARELAASTGAIVAITGAIDLISDGDVCYVIRNGRPEMGMITGTGCQLSGVMTAFAVANKDNKAEACAAAVALMGLAGEIGWSRMLEGDGNSTYRNRIIDAIFNMDAETLDRGARYELR